MSGDNWRGVVRLSFVAALRYVRLTPFDVQTDQGRRDERYRVALLSILANVLSRVVGVVLTLLSVSLTLPYLGVERFGIWMTVASFAAMLTFLDLGVGNALTNHAASSAARTYAAHLHCTPMGIRLRIELAVGAGLQRRVALGMRVILFFLVAFGRIQSKFVLASHVVPIGGCQVTLMPYSSQCHCSRNL